MAIVVALATFVFSLLGLLGDALSLKTVWTTTAGRSLFSVLYMFTLTVDTLILIMRAVHEVYQLAWSSYSDEIFFVITILGNVALTAAAGLAVERFDSLKSFSHGKCNSANLKCLLVSLVLLVSSIITPWVPLMDTQESDARDALYSGLPMLISIFIAGIVWSFTKHIIKLENSIQDSTTNGQDEISVNNFRENISCSKAVRWVILEEVLTHALIAPVVIAKILETSQSYQQISQAWWISLLKVISTSAKPFSLLIVSSQFRKTVHRCCFHHQMPLFLFSGNEVITSCRSHPAPDTRRDSVSVFAVSSLDNNHLACAAVTSFQGRRVNRTEKPSKALSDTKSVVTDKIYQSQKNVETSRTSYQSIITKGKLRSSLSKGEKDQDLQRCQSEESLNTTVPNEKCGTPFDVDRKVINSCPDLRLCSMDDENDIPRERSNTLSLPPFEQKFKDGYKISFEDYKLPLLQERRVVDRKSSLCNLVKESWGSLHLSSLNDILSISEVLDVKPKHNDGFVDCDASLCHDTQNEARECADKIAIVAMRLSQSAFDVEGRSAAGTPEIDPDFSKFELPKEKSKQRINISRRQSASPQVSLLASRSRPGKRSRYSLQCLSESGLPRNRITSFPNALSAAPPNECYSNLPSTSRSEGQRGKGLPEPKIAFTTPRASLVSITRSPKCVRLGDGFFNAVQTNVRMTSPALQHDSLHVVSTLSTPSASPLSKVKGIHFDFEEHTAPVSPANCHIDMFHPESFVYLGNGDVDDSPT